MISIREYLVAVFLLLGCDIFVLSEIPRPRGVSISKAVLYPPGEHFTCLDGLKTIKYIQINDDFCDCADSSDEPGTSACPNGVFHCTNAGHKPRNIPSSRVNDGICDCCDASDEYTSGSACTNDCLELGREERQKEKVRQELLKQAAVIRNDLIAKGKALRAEREARIAELEQHRAEAEALRLEKEAIKKEIEEVENDLLQAYKEIQEAEKKEQVEQEATNNRQEAEETFVKYDSNKDGYVDAAELKTRICFDQDRNGVVSDEEAKYFLDDRERVDLETFVTLSWPRVKPYLMLDSGIFKPPRDIEPEQQEVTHEDEGQEEADLATHQNYEENASEDGEQEQYEEEEEEEAGQGQVEEVGRQPEYDPDTQRVIEQANAARNEYSEAERSIREIEQEIKDIQEAFAKNYGKADEFATLDGECFNYEDREYVYKLCPFDRASQQPKNGGGETRLGTWDSWIGAGDNAHSSMLYKNGASCWNGPQRSAHVKVECGLDNKLLSVSEPNRCEYHFVFETPAACEPVDESKTNEIHDEL